MRKNQTGIRRGKSERGSALLVVLVMAAMIAILLYKEMPISAFEAQRQKEELLVERGGEYKHAIKLFVRKFGRFPGSLSELESTNRMRFLRRKYLDPLTGKDDWRLLHAGPGGVILDSKIKDSTNGKVGNASTLGQGATFAGFNNSIKQPDDAEAEAAATVPGLRQRSAATANAGPTGGVNGDFPPLPNTAGTAVAGVGNGQGLYPGIATPGTDPVTGAAGQPNSGGMNPAMPNGATGPNNVPLSTLASDPGVAAAMTAAGMTANGGMAVSGNPAVTQQLNTQNPLTPQGPAPTNSASPATPGGLQNSGAFPQNGQPQQNAQGLAGGGIAGVASIAPGKSIKNVNDQTKYSLWEFVFDLRKEQQANIPGAAQQNPNANGQSGINGSTSNSASGPNAASSFGPTPNGPGSNGTSFGPPITPVAPGQGAPVTPPQN